MGGMTIVYKSSVDLFLYVVGSSQENEVGPGGWGAGWGLLWGVEYSGEGTHSTPALGSRMGRGSQHGSFWDDVWP